MKNIQILGTGCPKCRQLAENAESAVRTLGADVTIEKISDITQIIKFGVMITPALAVDGEVKSAGKVISSEDIQQILTQGADA